MMLALTTAAFSFAPSAHPRLPAVRATRASTPLMGPLETIASPLRKFDAPNAVSTGSMTDGAPLEVQALFAVIFLVGVAGLVRGSGVLDSAAVQTALASVKGDAPAAAPEAASPVAEAPQDPTDISDMSQAQQEAMYFKQIAKDLGTKRGGSSKRRKKAKK